MKILVLSTMYPNSRIFLSGVFVHEQTKKINEMGCSCFVVAPIPFFPKSLGFLKKRWHQFSEIKEEEEIDGIKILHSKYIAIPKGYFKHYWSYLLSHNAIKKLERTHSGHDINIIHAHGSLPEIHAAKLLAKHFKVPYLITIHGDAVYNNHRNKFQFNKIMESLNNAARIIAVSNVVKNKIEEIYGIQKRIKVVYNGFNKYKDLIPEQTLKTKEITNVLFVGNLIERKGCHILIKAFAKTISTNKAILTIVGDGKQKSSLMKMCKELGIDSWVNFIGRIPHIEILRFMANCDIFVLPSWDEAFGVVYLEALSYKKPIIGTQNEGIADFIKHGINGILVKRGNVDELAYYLQKLIEDPTLRAKFGNKGFESIKNLTWENSAKNCIKTYKEILNEKNINVVTK